MPLLTTTIKPEGTLSPGRGGVSSGLHVSQSILYTRVRINATDPLATLALKLGWKVYAEVATEYNGEKIYDVEKLQLKEVIDVAKIIVIEFPVKSGATELNKQTVRNNLKHTLISKNIHIT